MTTRKRGDIVWREWALRIGLLTETPPQSLEAACMGMASVKSFASETRSCAGLVAMGR